MELGNKHNNVRITKKTIQSKQRALEQPNIKTHHAQRKRRMNIKKGDRWAEMDVQNLRLLIALLFGFLLYHAHCKNRHPAGKHEDASNNRKTDHLEKSDR